MVAKISTITLDGIAAREVVVEVQVAPGLASFQIVGLPDNAVKESKERIRAAFYASRLALPAKRITVNLAPAHVHKSGSHYDVPIAIGLLCALGIVPPESVRETFFMGELGLDGTLKAVRGVLSAVLCAMEAETIGALFVPEENAQEAAWCSSVETYGVRTLADMIAHLLGETRLAKVEASPSAFKSPHTGLDLADVKGQEMAKRALEIAAAGGHNMLMSGPPGSGKSMLAQRLSGLLPMLDTEHALEVSMIHSVAGKLSHGLQQAAPYRDPHHSASAVALSGGGMRALPGEMSLAHQGVLFMDELPEFNRTVLETLRQPMETGSITVSRANHHITYPAQFQLIAAMNPCPCGYLGDESQSCRCTPKAVQLYQNKLSGPLLDRIDVHVGVSAVPFHALSQESKGESSAQVKARVTAAREMQKARYQHKPYHVNARMSAGDVETFVPLTPAMQQLLERAHQKLALSARSFHRILRVARTIADLQGSAQVQEPHLLEALNYRYQPYPSSGVSG